MRARRLLCHGTEPVTRIVHDTPTVACIGDNDPYNPCIELNRQRATARQLVHVV